MSIPIPKSTEEVFTRYKGVVHAGLLLDKFVNSFSPDAGAKWQERVQRPTVDRVVAQKHISSDEWTHLLARREAILTGSAIFRAQTTGPLTMHLSRAGALENAGICLHPLYGVAYLPGTGLKGLARAYAETIAKPAGLATDADIRAVFGHAPTRSDKTESAGSIIFHDAWPTAVPQLILDIVNNHHGDYYTGTGNENPPGDWEDPLPVYFLAVAPKTTFHFALAKRRDDTDAKLLNLARQWLLGGLIHLGAGAKTNAGYGAFVEVIDDKIAPRPKLPARAPRATFECTLELVSPAFLAGAKQDATDCDLRPATLRGQLRWWWRTLHAGYLNVEQLRTLEAAIWGDTKRGGAVRITLETTKRTSTKSIREKRNGSPSDPIKYISYGMDDDPDRPARVYLEPGASWSLSLSARTAHYAVSNDEKSPTVALSQSVVLDQATAALSLLCTFGGVGAKARKGFGSLSIRGDGLNTLPGDVKSLIAKMKQIRTTLGLPNTLLQDRNEPYPALDDVFIISPIEGIARSAGDVWDVIRDTGQRLKAYISDLPKPGVSNERAALGLPRSTMTVKEIKRHPSPYHIHLGKSSDGTFILSAIAFTVHQLPTAQVSRTVLDGFLNVLDAETAPTPTPRRDQRAVSVPATSVKPLPKPKPVVSKPIQAGQERDGTLESINGGWQVRFESDQVGRITNPDKVPPDAAAQRALFRIVAFNKKDGISARFERLK